MILNSIVAWLVSLMVTVAPVGRPTQIEAAKETPAEAEVRYEGIARDLVSVVYDEAERPMFNGPQGRAKTAAVLLAIASFESDFRRDVDYGEGPLARGDGGKSWCLGQINLGEPTKDGLTKRRIYVDQAGYYVWSGQDQIGYSGQDLVQDRKKCFQAMLWMARTSFALCSRYHRNTHPEFLLNLYTSGNCLVGYESSQKRLKRAKKWIDRTLPEVRDESVIAELLKPTGSVQASLWNRVPALVAELP